MGRKKEGIFDFPYNENNRKEFWKEVISYTNCSAKKCIFPVMYIDGWALNRKPY